MNSSAPIHRNSHAKVLRLWILGLALALLLAQMLGQLHAVKHAGKLGGHTGTIYDADKQAAYGGFQRDVGQGNSFLDRLFSSHSSTSDCRLYDHLGNGLAMPQALAAFLPIIVPSLLVAIFAGDALARWAALFDARGPPLTS